MQVAVKLYHVWEPGILAFARHAGRQSSERRDSNERRDDLCLSWGCDEGP